MSTQQKVTKTPMLCFHCGEEFVIEDAWPGFDPKKICFCSCLCAAKGSTQPTIDATKLVLQSMKKEEKEKEEEEFPIEWLLM